MLVCLCGPGAKLWEVSKVTARKVIDFYKSVNVWHLLQPPLVFNVNKAMSDIDQAVKGLLESKWRADINSEISHKISYKEGETNYVRIDFLNAVLVHHMI